MADSKRAKRMRLPPLPKEIERALREKRGPRPRHENTADLAAERRVRPTEYVRKVKSALRAAEGHILVAAEDLGVSGRTLKRWISEDTKPGGLLDGVDLAPRGELGHL